MHIAYFCLIQLVLLPNISQFIQSQCPYSSACEIILIKIRMLLTLLKTKCRNNELSQLLHYGYSFTNICTFFCIKASGLLSGAILGSKPTFQD
jgi:hypothetical protein